MDICGDDEGIASVAGCGIFNSVDNYRRYLLGGTRFA
jgi:hypothetical protein